MAHRLDERALHQVGRLARVHHLPADVDRRPGLRDLDLLVISDFDFDDVGHIAGVGELERDAFACALRQLAAVVPVRHVANRFEYAARARRVEVGHERIA